MGKLLGALIGVAFALAGPAAIAYGGYWWAMDRPAWHFGPCPFCIGWGPGANAKLAISAHDFTTEQASFRRLQAAFTAENAAVRALAKAGDALQARSAAAVRQATQANAWRLSLANQIIHAPPPADASPLGQCWAAEAVLREGGR